MWIEQLVAESLGKRGEGLFLVPTEPFTQQFTQKGELGFQENSKCLDLKIGEFTSNFDDKRKATVCLKDEYDIAAQFFHWEMATAVAAAHIGINPFDEPNVAEAKQKTSELLSQSEAIELPKQQHSIQQFLSSLAQSEYLALLVYAEDCDENAEEIAKIKSAIEKQIDLPVTVNYGPRYLHSVGQIHKGGKQHGAFLLLLDLPDHLMPIPGKNFGFDKLFCAQALGDFQILREKGLPTEFITIKDWQDIDI